jgi:predicted ArsR family transcriptional regulator
LISDLSAGLAAFLRDCISSYEEVETLLLLARSPARSWSVDEIARSLNVTVDAARAALARLVDVGDLIETVVTSPPRYRYEPGRDALRTAVNELDHAFVEQRLAVVQVMNQNALDRVRGSAARRLAQAFRPNGRRNE